MVPSEAAVVPAPVAHIPIDSRTGQQRFRPVEVEVLAISVSHRDVVVALVGLKPKDAAVVSVHVATVLVFFGLRVRDGDGGGTGEGDRHKCGWRQEESRSAYER